MKKHFAGLLVGTALTLGAVVSIARGAEVTPEAVITHYGDVAEAMYSDARAAAGDLSKAVDALIANPNQETLDAARKAWRGISRAIRPIAFRASCSARAIISASPAKPLSPG